MPEFRCTMGPLQRREGDHNRDCEHLTSATRTTLVSFDPVGHRPDLLDKDDKTLLPYRLSSPIMRPTDNHDLPR